MNNEKDKELDDFFRKGLEDPVNHAVYKEKDWNSLDEMLNRHSKRRGAVYWLPVLSSAAALLLLFVGWWIFRANPVHPPSKLQAVNPHQQLNTDTGGRPVVQPTDHKQISAVTAHFAEKGNRETSVGGKRFSNLSAAGSGRGSTGSRPVANENLLDGTPGGLYRDNAALLAVSPAPVFEVQQPGSQSVITYNVITPLTAAVKNSAETGNAKDKIKIKQQPAYRPQFAVSVLAAPDLNGVGSFQQGKVGTNAGLLFSAGVSKKFTISTGVLYSVKPYLTNFSDYHTQYKFLTQPVSVTADCRMLDIPLDLGYQLYHKRQNKLSVGTGLSSYIMLHESYKFNYANAYTSGPSGYKVPNSSKYFFGVLNLNATYERQLNSKLGVTLQPYMKLPLTNIGYSQVKLQSTGVAVGLKWNLNPSVKP
ncbi:MAG: hypothetical protein M3N14_09775 [Bacteroidota bacterium]|nr:hypothetical protein [Bacteroidota bacterium]